MNPFKQITASLEISNWFWITLCHIFQLFRCSKIFVYIFISYALLHVYDQGYNFLSSYFFISLLLMLYSWKKHVSLFRHIRTYVNTSTCPVDIPELWEWHLFDWKTWEMQFKALLKLGNFFWENSKGIWTRNYLVCKRTLNHLAELAYSESFTNFGKMSNCKKFWKQFLEGNYFKTSRFRKENFEKISLSLFWPVL